MKNQSATSVRINSQTGVLGRDMKEFIPIENYSTVQSVQIHNNEIHTHEKREAKEVSSW